MGMSAADRLEKADALMAKSDEALRGGRPRTTPADARRKSMEKKKRRKPKWQGPGPGAYNVDDSKVSAPPSGLRLASGSGFCSLTISCVCTAVSGDGHEGYVHGAAREGWAAVLLRHRLAGRRLDVLAVGAGQCLARASDVQHADGL